MELTLAMVKPDAKDRIADIEQCICDRVYFILEIRYGNNSGYIMPDAIDLLADLEQCIRDHEFSILEVGYGTNSGYDKA